jgi:hypothetical protein
MTLGLLEFRKTAHVRKIGVSIRVECRLISHTIYVSKLTVQLVRTYSMK